MQLDLPAFLADPPRLHTFRGELISRWRIDDQTVRELDARVKPGMTTLETGAGISTIIFAAKGCHHTCIVPDEGLIGRIKDYCATKEINIESVKFIAAKSADVIHQLQPNSFDLVLIDGNHGFPTVFVDFFYATKALRVGGSLVQDDMHIYTCHLVADLMRTDPGWKLDLLTNRVAIARKIEETIDKDWGSQALTRNRSSPVHKHPVVFARAAVRTLWQKGPIVTLQKVRERLSL